MPASEANQNDELKCVIIVLTAVVLLQIPSSHLNPRTFPQFVRIRGFSLAVNDGFETILRRPKIKRCRARMNAGMAIAIINATTVIVRNTSLKSCSRPTTSAVPADWKASHTTSVRVAWCCLRAWSHSHGPNLSPVNVCSALQYWWHLQGGSKENSPPDSMQYLRNQWSDFNNSWSCLIRTDVDLRRVAPGAWVWWGDQRFI